MNLNYAVSLCTLFFVTFSFTQNANPQNGNTNDIIDVRVVNETRFGNHYFYIFQEVVNENSFYKSSAVEEPLLEMGQEARLADNNRSDRMLKVVQPTLPRVVYARRTDDPSNNEGHDFFDIRMPVLENNILFFEDEEHYYEVYEYLESMYLQESGVPVEKRFERFERLFPGFISNRKNYYDKFYHPGITLTEIELKDVFERQVVDDMVLQTLLNECNMIGIDCDVYHYFDLNILFSIDKNFEGGISLLEDAFTTDGYNVFDADSDILNIDEITLLDNEYVKIKETKISGVIAVENDLDNGNGGNITYVNYYDGAHLYNPCKEDDNISNDTINYDDLAKTGLKIVADRAYRVRLTERHIVEDCNPFLKGLRVRVQYSDEAYKLSSGGQVSLDPNSLAWNTYKLDGKNAILTIDWGDNTIETIENYDGKKTVFHEYPIDGGVSEYKPKISISFYDDFDNEIVEFEEVHLTGDSETIFDVVKTCGKQEGVNGSFKDDGDWLLWSRVWTTDNFLSRKVGATSFALRNEGPNAWSHRVARHLSSSIDAVFLDNECDKTNRKTRSRRSVLPRKEFTVNRSKQNLFRRRANFRTTGGEFDIKSTHRLESSSGSDIYEELILNVCD